MGIRYTQVVLCDIITKTTEVALEMFTSDRAYPRKFEDLLEWFGTEEDCVEYIAKVK